MYPDIRKWESKVRKKMITTLLALAAVSGIVQEPIDFRLGWKIGDQLTYTLGIGDEDMQFMISGDVVLTVLSENEKGFTVGATRTEFKVDINYKGVVNYPFRPLPAGTITFSHKAGVIEKPNKNSRDVGVEMSFVHAVLPSKPVSVGDKFSVSLNYYNSRVELEGTFVSLDAERNLAKFEFTGQVTFSNGPVMQLTNQLTFDTKRKIFVSLTENMNNGLMIRSFKLKEPPK